jgi:hypothetical protein
MFRIGESPPEVVETRKRAKQVSDGKLHFRGRVTMHVHAQSALNKELLADRACWELQPNGLFFVTTLILRNNKTM